MNLWPAWISTGGPFLKVKGAANMKKYDPAAANFDAIPLEMKAVKRWVCWTADKTPINPHTLHGASSTNSSTWGTFDEAAAAMGKQASYRGADGQTTAVVLGVGFVLGGGWAGIDLDGGQDHGGGVVNQTALSDAEALGTYAEYSKSGEGYHFIGKYTGGKLDGTANKAEGVEIYTGAHYFAMTGLVYRGGPVADISAGLPGLHEKYIGGPRREAQQRAASSSTGAGITTGSG